MKHQPTALQIEDLRELYTNKRWGLWHEPSCRKTGPICMLMGYLWRKEKVKSIFSMPLAILQKNYDELLDWTGMDPEEIQVVTGGTKAQLDKQLSNPKAGVFMMGFERFKRSWRDLVALHPDIQCHCSDEAHLGFAGTTSQRAQALVDSYRPIDRWHPMTGTPINGKIDSIYPIIQGFGDYYLGAQDFLKQHKVVDPFDSRMVSWVYLEKITAILNRHGRRRTVKEVHGDQEVIIQKVMVQMTDTQREAYRMLEDLALAQLGDGTTVDLTQGNELMMCLQIMAHPWSVGKDKLDLLKGGPRVTGKTEQLEIILSNNGAPIVVFGVLVGDVENAAEVARKLGRKVGVITGKVSAAARGQVDKDFREGVLDTIIATAATASIGFNWDRADDVVFMSLDWLDGNFVQAYRRCLRGGAKKSLRVWLMEYKDSMDQVIFGILGRKSRLANQVDKTMPILDLQGDNPRISYA